MDVSGKTIVITGGASGIGRALAVECMRRGASVAVADLDESGARETKTIADSTRQPDTQCTVHALDVTSLDAWRSFREEVLAAHSVVDGIINNAGTAGFGTVEETTYEQIERIMSINFMGMVYGSKEFLPILKERPAALIANVSSSYGLHAKKFQAAYCASKSAIKAFTESLSLELKLTQVLVSTIFPGHIGTNIAHNARDRGNLAGEIFTDEEHELIANYFRDYGMPASRAAEVILDSLDKRKRRIVVGKDAIRGDRLSRLSPQRYVDYANRGQL